MRVQLVRDDCVEGSVSRSNNGNGAFDDGVVDDLGKIVPLTEGIQGGVHVRPQSIALGFKIDEEDEGLFWLGIKHAMRPVILRLR